METNRDDQQAENNSTQPLPEDKNKETENSEGGNPEDGEQTEKKKHHYDSSKWHSPVSHVRPTHTGLDL